MISCIVTTYKRPVNILKRAVDSVINQTCQDTEIIVVNDAPQDRELAESIRELLGKYSREIIYVVSEQSGGACSARNLGLEKATGEFVAFLDDDDEWLPEKLERQLHWMRKKDVALVYCSHYVIDKAGKKRLIEEPLAREGQYEDEFEQLLRCNFIGSTSYPLIRTETIRSIGGFTVGLKSSQDHDLWLRLAREYDIVYCREPLVILYYSQEAISRSFHNCLQGYEYLLEKYRDEYWKDKEILNYRLNYIAYYCMITGEWRYYLKYWFKALGVKLISRHNLMVLEKSVRKLIADRGKKQVEDEKG